MSLFKKTPSYIQIAALILLIAIGSPVWAQVPRADEALVAAIKTGNLAQAEQLARSQLDSVSKGETETADQLAARQKAQTALATVFAARAWEADLRSRGSRITGSDLLSLIVIALVAAALLTLLLRYGPQRPKVVDQTVQWVGKMSHKNQDDGFRQAGTAMLSLLIFGLIAGGILVVTWCTLHLVATLDAAERLGPEARKYFEEAKKLMTEARPKTGSVQQQYQDFDALALYAKFLRQTGDAKQAAVVERQAVAMWKRDSCNLKTRPPGH